MKRTLTLAIAIATMVSSCKKNDISAGSKPATIAVTFKKDSSVSDQTVQPPKNNQLIFSGKFTTGSINSFNLTGVKITMKKNGDAALPYEYLKKIHLVSEGTFSSVPLSMTKDSVNDNEFVFTNFVINFAQYQIGTIKIYADILSTATNGIGLQDDLVISVQLIYTGHDPNNNTVQYFQTGIEDGHKTIFSSTPVIPTFSVVSIADPATPASGVILDGQEKPGISYFVKVTGVSGTVVEHRLLVQGQAANAVTVLKLFDGSNNLIAQANVLGGVAIITTSDAVSAGTQKNYVVKPVVTVTSGDVSNYDFTVTLDAVKASSTVGEQKTDGTDRTGNPFTVLKAILDIKKVSVPTLSITNGAMDLYIVDLTAVNGDVSLKECTYDILLNDQGVNDTLSLKSFQIFNGSGADITSQFRFTDAASTIDTIFSESDSKLRTTRISGTGETVIPAGTTLRLTFRAVVGGFNHPFDGDGFSVIPITDGTSSTGLKYVNSGGISNGNAKLYSSAASSTSAINFYLIWSDYASPNHNGLFIQTSNDWIGGDRVTKTLSVNNFHQ